MGLFVVHWFIEEVSCLRQKWVGEILHEEVTCVEWEGRHRCATWALEEVLHRVRAKGFRIAVEVEEPRWVSGLYNLIGLLPR